MNTKIKYGAKTKWENEFKPNTREIKKKKQRTATKIINRNRKVYCNYIAYCVEVGTPFLDKRC